MPTHEFDGEKYKLASKHQKEWGSAIIMGLELSGSESVLDLGCGDGVLTKQIADLVPSGSVTGIDASEGMITTARKLECGNLKFHKMDINDISYVSGFDVIFSNAALHWVKDHTLLIRNCSKALKPGGVLRFNFAGAGNCANFFNVIKQVMNRTEYRQCFEDFQWPWYMPSIDEYTEIVSRESFKEIKIWEENADRYFENRHEMIKWIEQPSIVPFLKLVDEERKNLFTKEVIDLMIDKIEGADGRCFETFRRINVYAVK